MTKAVPVTAVPERVTAKLLVGYRLRTAPNLEDFRPVYAPPVRTKDPDKRAAFVTEKNEAFAQKALRMPYTATFDEVFLSSPRTMHSDGFRWSDDKTKPAICVQVAKWILARFPNAWSPDVIKRNEPEVIIVGFEPRLFLKILGLECSLPENSMPLPLGLWYDNNDHRDIGKAVVPSECEDDLALLSVLKRRGISIPTGWSRPGISPAADVTIAAELGRQLGILNR